MRTEGPLQDAARPWFSERVSYCPIPKACRTAAAESHVVAGESRFIAAANQRAHGRVATRSSFWLITAVMFALPGGKDRAELLRPTLAPLT